jgi:hypothetical protein
MKMAMAVTAAVLFGAALPVSGEAQAHQTDKPGTGGMMGGGMTGGHGGANGGAMGGGMMGGHGAMGGMISGQMMGAKSKQMAAMSDMMRSMGEAMEMQAHAMKGSDLKARRDAMMKIGKDATSAAGAMMRMSSEMGSLHDMGAMQMAPPAAEMMNKSMAAQKEATQMMQQEAEGAAAR